MSALRDVVVLLGLGLVQTFLPLVWSGFSAVDWILVYVVHEALRSSMQRSILLGAGGGLVQDGLAGGIIGLHAFAKTTVAALIVSLAGVLVVRGPIPEALFVSVAAAAEAIIVVGWQTMLGRPASLGPLDITFRGVATGVATFAMLMLARRWQQRRLRGPRTFRGRRR